MEKKGGWEQGKREEEESKRKGRRQEEYRIQYEGRARRGDSVREQSDKLRKSQRDMNLKDD